MILQQEPVYTLPKLLSVSDKVILYPNPAKDYINISFNPGNAKEVNLTIVDVQGNCISGKQ